MQYNWKKWENVRPFWRTDELPWYEMLAAKSRMCAAGFERLYHMHKDAGCYWAAEVGVAIHQPSGPQLELARMAASKAAWHFENAQYFSQEAFNPAGARAMQKHYDYWVRLSPIMLILPLNVLLMLEYDLRWNLYVWCRNKLDMHSRESDWATWVDWHEVERALNLAD